MMSLARQIVGHHDWLWRLSEPSLDAVVACDAPDLRDVQGAVVQGDAVWPAQAARHDARRAAAGADRIDIAIRAADEERATLAEGERARASHVVRIHADAKARWQADVFQAGRGGRARAD